MCRPTLPVNLRRFVLMLMLPLMLAACGAKSVVAPAADVQRAFYHDDGPTALTLYTVINNRSGEGAHAALLVSGSQRVLFDPAGSWYNNAAPEVNDVMYGMTPRLVEIYEDYHARETYHIIIQHLEVSPQVAELALTKVRNYGAVPPAFCSNSVSTILTSLPGFESLKRSMFPKRLGTEFGKLPGVTTRTMYDDDSDDNKAKLIAQN